MTMMERGDGREWRCVVVYMVLKDSNTAILPFLTASHKKNLSFLKLFTTMGRSSRRRSKSATARKSSSRRRKERNTIMVDTRDVKTSRILFISCVLIEIAFGVFVTRAGTTAISNWWEKYENKEYIYAFIAIAVITLGYKVTKSAEDVAYFRGREGKEASSLFLRMTKICFCFGMLGFPSYFTDQYLFGLFPGLFCFLLAYYASYHFSTTEEQTGGVSDERIYTRRTFTFSFLVILK